MKKSTKYIIGVVLLLTVALIGFGGSENRELSSNQFSGHGGGGASTQTSGTAGSSFNEATTGDFTLKRLGGGEITLSDYIGDKPVILDFWASWCPNCRRDMPKLSKFYDKYKDQVEVIGVNLQEREGTVSKYISGAGISFPIVLDPQGIASRKFGVGYTNFHVLINIDGSIAGTVPGDINEGQVLALINGQQVVSDSNPEEQIGLDATPLEE